MDQNACSTPHMIFWLSQDKDMIEQAQSYFWEQVYEEAKKYALEDIKVSEKYTNLCLYATQNEKATEERSISVQHYENILYVIKEKNIPINLCEKRGKFGMFYQCNISDLSEIKDCINSKIQTVAIAGIEKKEVQEWIVENRLKGIDRVVSFGKTLDIGLIWDGYDLIAEMSRVIG